MSGVNKRRTKKDKLVEGALRRQFARNPEDADLIAMAMIFRAKGGDIAAATFVRDSIDGKPHQSIDMDVDVSDNLTTSTVDELTKAVRDRMAGILPRRAVSSLEGDREPGPGSDTKLN